MIQITCSGSTSLVFRKPAISIVLGLKNTYPSTRWPGNYLELKRENYPIYGYGILVLMFAMAETILRNSNNPVNISILKKALPLGKKLLENK